MITCIALALAFALSRVRVSQRLSFRSYVFHAIVIVLLRNKEGKKLTWQSVGCHPDT